MSSESNQNHGLGRTYDLRKSIDQSSHNDINRQIVLYDQVKDCKVMDVIVEEQDQD
jgi:hypothetical protein